MVKCFELVGYEYDVSADFSSKNIDVIAFLDFFSFGIVHFNSFISWYGSKLIR